ncbi:MAG: sugar ABC transporter substrate-binding protein [Chloroflexota bacterium]
MLPIANHKFLQRIPLSAAFGCIFAVIAGMLLLGACTPAHPAQETVSFMVFGDPAERQAYINLVDAFHQAHPDIHIEINHVPSPREYRTRLATEFAAGTPPDVSIMNYRRYAGFAANQLFEPIGPMLASSDIIDAGDFYPIAIEAFTWQGEITCLPQNISSLVVYYNEDLFDAAGLPYPADDWTWDDFVNTALTLTQDLDDDGDIDQYGLGIELSLYRLSPFVWQNDAPIVDDNIKPARLTLTRPPSLAALQWFVDLRQVHGVIPTRIEETALDSESRFAAGMTAMFLNSRRGTPSYREITAFSWDVAPLPKGKSSAGILHADGYCLSKTASNKAAAWTFIEYANSFDGQTIIAGSGRTVPSLIEVAESSAFLNPDQAPSRSAVWLDTIPTLHRVPVISTWEEIEKIASGEIERAVYGEITAEEAANLAFLRTEEYFFLAKFSQSR